MSERVTSRVGTSPGSEGTSPSSSGPAESSAPARAVPDAGDGMIVEAAGSRPQALPPPDTPTHTPAPDQELRQLRAEVVMLRHRLYTVEKRLLPVEAAPEPPATLWDSVPVPALCMDADGLVRMVNRSFETAFGVRCMEMYGRGLAEQLPAGVAAQLAPLLARAVAGEQRVTGKLAVCDGAGERHFSVTLTRRGLPGNGGMCRVLLVGVEITDALTTRQARHETGETCRALLDAAPGAVFLVEPDGVIVAHNSAASRYARRNGQDMTGENLCAHMPVEVAALHRAELARCAATGRSGFHEDREGERVLRHSLVPVHDTCGRVTQIAVYVHDVTAQRRAEKELQVSLERKGRMVHDREAALGRHTRLLQRIYDDVPVGLLHTCAAGTVIEVNRALCAITGLHADKVKGTHVLDYVLPECRELLAHEMRRNRAERDRVARFEVRVRRPDGQIRLCRVTSTMVWGAGDPPLFGLGVVEDQTELHRLRAEAVRAGHLAALGELAAGVAHEINNPINGIINCAQLLLDDADAAAQGGMRHVPQPELAGRILREGQRIAGIVRNLLFFGRDRRDTNVRVDLREVLLDALALTRTHMADDGVVIDLELADAPLMVAGRPGELQQVFMNLLANAHYALNAVVPAGVEHSADRGRPKRLLLTAGGADSCAAGCGAEHRALGRPGGHPAGCGPRVCVTVADTGTGIEPAVLDRVFEPFFTTKAEGKGTGLGLSISYGIIKSHGGTLMLDSDGISGTRATVILPEAPPEASVASPGACKGPGAGRRAPSRRGSRNARQGAEATHGEDTAR